MPATGGPLEGDISNSVDKGCRIGRRGRGGAGDQVGVVNEGMGG